MKKKWFAVFFMVVCTICCAFGLTACGEKGDNQHTHTYSTEWSHDAENHWHAATCEHASEVKDKAAHDMENGVCAVCGYEDNSAPKVYKTVSFNLNGGEGELENMQFVVGKLMADLPVPARKGYTFICWEEAFGGEFTAASVMPNRNLTLVAKWEKVLTKYSDKFVSLKPATEGCKNDLLQLEYAGEVDKFVYVEITSDDLGGVEKVGQSNNFNLRSMEGMEYKVNSGYSWAWFQGSFDVPNGAQRFTLNYGSNVQFVTISDGDGVVQQTYLVDLYVMHDYYVSLYNNIYETEPYEEVRVIENDRFAQSYETPESKFEADKRVYFNTETGKYEDFVYTTAITKNWNLYQTYKPYTAEVELDGGTVEGEVKFTPYTPGYALPIPVKEGYDFIGWKNGNGKYLTDMEGNGGVKYIAEKTNGKKPEAITFGDKLIAAFEVKNMFYQADSDGVKSFEAIRNLTYTNEYEKEISETEFTVQGNYTGTVNRVKVGDEVTVTAGKLGHTFTGWYNGETKLSDNAEYKFAMPLELINYTIKYEVAEELKPFEVEATADTLTITAIKDKTATEIVVPDYVTEIEFGVFEECNSLEKITLPFVGVSKDGTENTHLGYIFGAESYSDNSSCVPASLKTVIVTSTESLGERAFSGCIGLTGITIPDSVTSIGGYAFSNCDGLTSITIPEKVTSIGNYAFVDCDGLTSITIPDSVKSVGEFAFNDCSGLTSITIGNGVTGIGQYTFWECTNLTSVTMGNSVTSIGQYAFWKCTSLTSITIPDSVTSIHSSAFSDCYRLVEVYNKSSLTITAGSGYDGSVGHYAKNVYTTEGGSKLTTAGDFVIYDGNTIVDYKGTETEVTVPENITTINRFAFCGYDGLTSVTIPDSVTSIGDGAFYNCSSLKSITVPFVGASKNGTENTHFGYLFGSSSYEDNSKSVPVSLKTVIITGGRIGNSAFSGCTGLTGVTLNKGVTNIGNYAFNGCTGLTSVLIPDSVTSIGWNAFSGCNGLTSVIIPDSVTSIGDGAFYNCSSLKSITVPFVGASKNGTSNTYFGYIFGASRYNDNSTYVPYSLKTVIITGGEKIAASAFRNCSGLTSITIPESVTSIGDDAFSGCYRLVEVYNKSPLTITAGSSDNGYVGYCVKNVYTADGGSKLTIDGDFVIYDGNTFVDYMGTETGVTISEGITTINDYAFYGLTKIASVTIPDGVTSIGERAFSGCSSLTTVTISDGVISIGEYAFYNCDALANITIPDSVTSIGSYAFAYCDGLTSVSIGNKVSSISDYAFSYCGKLSSVIIGNGVTSIGSNAFSSCSGLTSITIPDGVISIGGEAFAYCSKLASVTIGKGVTSIGSGAFYDCNSVTSITIPFVGASKGGTENTHFGYLFGSSSYEYNSSYVPASLKTVIITGGESIDDYAFYRCGNLTSVTILDGVTSIDRNAFSRCHNLTSVTIPDSVTSIGGEAFYNCTSLTSITFNGTIEQWNSITKESWYLSTNYTITCTDGKLDKNGNVVTE